MTSLDNKNVSKHLGQTSEYKSTYDPSLLVREPRQSNRTYLDIDDGDLPFVGNDTWNAYEISALTNNGLPVVGVAKLYTLVIVSILLNQNLLSCILILLI